MTDMPHPTRAYLHHERTRHRTWVYYFRRGKGKRIRMPEPYGSAAFEEAYNAALLASGNPDTRRITGRETVTWLIERYRETAAYATKSYATRRQRDNIFKRVEKKSGHEDMRKLTVKAIEKGLLERASTPAQARNFFDAMRGLCRWAVKAGHLKTDPTASIEYPTRQATDGFAPWTDADVAAYEAKWPEGSRERVWMHVLLYTGLRRGDAVTVGRQHVKNGIITLKTEKTGIEVHIPLRTKLAATLAKGPVGDLAYITGRNGKPITKESFGNFFRVACNKAGVTKSAHGLRKLAATVAAESGATVDELDALFGWEGGQMASRYTKAADRKRLARRAVDKIENAEVPHLDGESPAPKNTVAVSNG